MKTISHDLNKFAISNGIPADFSATVSDSHFDNVEVVFKNIEERLSNVIQEFQEGIIFGCVAWLTSKPILKALSKCRNVQILVQKEDFLRPDLGAGEDCSWKKELRQLYGELQFSFSRNQCLAPIRSLSVCNDQRVDSIRCIGNHNSEKKPVFPRAHHKFLVFCKLNKHRKYIPVKLWTGSFNITYNATQSFENVLLLSDKGGKNKILNAYLKEHHHLFTLSESLEWEKDWVSPEFRIGI